MKKIIKYILAILVLAIVTMFSTVAIRESNIVGMKNVANGGSSGGSGSGYVSHEMACMFSPAQFPMLKENFEKAKITSEGNKEELDRTRNKTKLLVGGDEEKFNSWLAEKGYTSREKELNDKYTAKEEEITKIIAEYDEKSKIQPQPQPPVDIEVPDVEVPDVPMPSYGGGGPIVGPEICSLLNQIDFKTKELEKAVSDIKELYKDELEFAMVEKLNQITQTLENTKTENDDKDAKIKELEGKLKKAQEECGSLEEINKLKEEAEKLKGEKEKVEKQLKEITEEYNKLKTSKEEADTKNTELETKMGMLEETIRVLNNTIKMKDATIAVLETKVLELTTQIAMKDAKIEELNSKVSDLEKKIEEKDEKITSLNEEIQKLNNQITELKKNEETNKEKISELEKKVEELKKQKAELEKENNNLKEELKKTQEEITKLKETIKKEQEEKEELKKEIERIKNSKEERPEIIETTRKEEKGKKTNTKTNNEKLPYAGLESMGVLSIVAILAIGYTKYVVKRK